MRTNGFGFGFVSGDLASLLTSPADGFCTLSCCFGGLTIDTAAEAALGAEIWNVLTDRAVGGGTRSLERVGLLLVEQHTHRANLLLYGRQRRHE